MMKPEKTFQKMKIRKDNPAAISRQAMHCALKFCQYPGGKCRSSVFGAGCPSSSIRSMFSLQKQARASKPVVGSSMNIMEGLATSSTAIVSLFRCSADKPVAPAIPTMAFFSPVNSTSANIVRMLKTSENPNKMPTQIQYQCHSVSNPLIFRIASPTVLAFA